MKISRILVATCRVERISKCVANDATRMQHKGKAMKSYKTPKQIEDEARDQIAELQRWFANKPYAYTESCGADQLQQYRDREKELERLQGLLAQ